MHTKLHSGVLISVAVEVTHAHQLQPVLYSVISNKNNDNKIVFLLKGVGESAR